MASILANCIVFHLFFNQQLEKILLFEVLNKRTQTQHNLFQNSFFYRAAESKLLKNVTAYRYPFF